MSAQMRFVTAMSERTVLSIATESTIFILINITAILGNCFVLAAISRNPGLRKIANWYILTLAMADLFVAVTCMPLTVGASLKGEWIYSDVICQIQGHVVQIWASFSLTIVAATAVHRYYRVVRPVRFREIFTKTFIVFMVISCFVLSAAAVMGFPFAIDASFQFGPHLFCTPNFPDQKTKRAVALSVYVAFTAIPSSILLFCYFKVYRAVRRHLILVMPNLRPQQQLHSDMKLSTRAEEMNTTKLVFAITTVFCVLWIPLCTIGALHVSHVPLPRWVHLMYDYLMFMTAATNPLVYGFMNKSFRAEYVRIAVRQGVKTGEQEGNGSPEKTKEKRGQKPAIPAIPPCLHEVQQRLQIASRPLQPLAQLPTTVMLYHRLSQTDGCRRRGMDMVRKRD
ncbi:Melatonin receptor type 1C [Acropora cervicornis]|uniref:Melatonin receptor type 1C n=1 Tax=Acropora cervicornis TaxID=6130 RepID=A0AAD9V3L2_ACRCE|nr:Melatonin receptor type 1C [Acropora cervicornis]